MKTFRWIAILMLAGLLTACGDPEESDGNNGAANNGGFDHPNVTCDGDVCQISGDVIEDLTLTPDRTWVLQGGVFVGDDQNETVVTVEPGTTVFGSTGTLSFLVIRRGSKIMAEGTADAPIVFTSAAEQRVRGDWGGLILNGRAPLNNCDSGTCVSEGEGDTGKYGGDDPMDDSGILRYVRVEFAGDLITSDNELNGIAFQGVGAGTTVGHVQVHMSKDDGIEFFGGTVNFKYILATGIGDDSLDWTDGWQGKGQFFIAQQYADNGDQGIEADNNGDNNSREPRSMPTLSNLTLLGAGPSGAASDVGILLREGTGANLHNVAVAGFNEGCLDIDNEATFTQSVDQAGELNGTLTITNSVIDCPDSMNFISDEENFTPPFTVEEWFTTLNEGNSTGDLMLEAPNDRENPNFMPQSGSPLLGAGSAPADSFFDDVDFIGGMGDEDWTAGWTTTELE